MIIALEDSLAKPLHYTLVLSLFSLLYFPLSILFIYNNLEYIWSFVFFAIGVQQKTLPTKLGFLKVAVIDIGDMIELLKIQIQRLNSDKIKLKSIYIYLVLAHILDRCSGVTPACVWDTILYQGLDLDLLHIKHAFHIVEVFLQPNSVNC